MVSIFVNHRDFRYLFVAELVMFGADWFALIPLVTLLQRLTGSGLPGALALAADTAVNASLLPYAGTLVDRLDRRKIMIVANLGFLVAVSLLFLVRSAGLAWVGPVAIGLAAATKAFYAPAAAAALPNMVDTAELPAATTLSGSAWGTMLVVGASLGGVVNGAVGPYACFGITIVCTVLAMALVWRVRRPMQADRGAAVAVVAPITAMREALRFIRRHPRVLSLVTVKSAVGVGNGVLSVFPVLATVVFAAGSVGTGLLFAARGLGVLVGPLLLGRVLAHRSWLMPGLAVSMVSYGLAYLGVAVSPWFWLALVLVAVAHMSGGVNWVMSTYSLQLEVPDALRGRVFATDMMMVTVAMSASLSAAGVLVDHVDPRLPIAVCASLTLVYGVAWRLATRRLMAVTGAVTPLSSGPDPARPSEAVPGQGAPG